MNEWTRALESAADGALLIDENLQVIYANPAASEILGFDAGELTGQACYQILAGKDDYGRLVCFVRCEVIGVAVGGGQVQNYDLQVQTKTKQTRWLNISVFVLPNPQNGGLLVAHLFRDITQKKNDERFFLQLLEIARRYHKLPSEIEEHETDETLVRALTLRELDVLSLLAQGLTTAEISQKLSISPHTTRNHIQHILQKLQVHSRLEAVTYAIQHRLVSWEPSGEDQEDQNSENSSDK